MQTSAPEPASDFCDLAAAVRGARLLDRRPVYYLVIMVSTVAAYAAGWIALFAIGDSWASLGIAVFLAIVFVQTAFVGHDAGHHQIFRSRKANQLVGLIAGDALIGLSFGWWVPKHNAHHAHPNVVGRDPDIGVGSVALTFTAESARSLHGARRMLARYQAWLFFPLLLLEGAGMHLSGFDALVRRRDRSAAVEGVLLLTHGALYLTAVLWVLSPLRAAAFIVVQQGLFGLYLGCSFAPNHKGMPVLDGDAGMGFAERQILTARNLSGGPLFDFVFGGLNLQIEHHLFPTMPRPNLPAARAMVRSFCADNRLPYHEETLLDSWRQALGYLNAVGHGLEPLTDARQSHLILSTPDHAGMQSGRSRLVTERA